MKFCTLQLHLTSGKGFTAGRSVVPDVSKHRGAFIFRVKRSKKGRQNILFTVTITWVSVTQHDLRRTALTDITNSSYRWMFPRKWPCSLLHLLNREEGATTLRNVAIYPVTEGNIHVDLDRQLRIKFVEIPSAIPAYAQHNFILHSFFLLSGFMRTHLDSFDAIQSNVQRISLYVSLYSSRTCEVKDVPFYVVL